MVLLKENNLGPPKHVCQCIIFTLETLWDLQSAIDALGCHWVSTFFLLVHAVYCHILIVLQPVGLKVLDPHLFGVVEDASSFDANGARSCRSFIIRTSKEQVSPPNCQFVS